MLNLSVRWYLCFLDTHASESYCMLLTMHFARHDVSDIYVAACLSIVAYQLYVLLFICQSSYSLRIFIPVLGKQFLVSMEKSEGNKGYGYLAEKFHTFVKQRGQPLLTGQCKIKCRLQYDFIYANRCWSSLHSFLLQPHICWLHHQR